MTISFSIQNSFELRTVVDVMNNAIEEIAENRLFREDNTVSKLMRGITLDHVADDMIASYHKNKEEAEYSVVAVAMFDEKFFGKSSWAECEYCKNRKDVENAIQLFKDKGFDESEISVKRLNYCQSHRGDDDDDTFFDDDSPTLLDEDDDDLDDNFFTDFSDDDT